MALASSKPFSATLRPSRSRLARCSLLPKSSKGMRDSGWGADDLAPRFKSIVQFRSSTATTLPALFSVLGSRIPRARTDGMILRGKPVAMDNGSVDAADLSHVTESSQCTLVFLKLLIGESQEPEILPPG